MNEDVDKYCLGSISVALLFGSRKSEAGGTLLAEALENVCAFSVFASGVRVCETEAGSRETGQVKESCLVYCTFWLLPESDGIDRRPLSNFLRTVMWNGRVQ